MSANTCTSLESSVNNEFPNILRRRGRDGERRLTPTPPRGDSSHREATKGNTRQRCFLLSCYCHGHAPSCAPATVGGATRPIHKQASKEEIRTIERHIHVGTRELEACLGEVRFSGLGIHLYLSAHRTHFFLHCRLIACLLVDDLHGSATMGAWVREPQQSAPDGLYLGLFYPYLYLLHTPLLLHM